MYQRYRLNIRFHRASENGDFFVGTIFGLETTNISELRNQVQKKSVKRHWWEEGEQETSDSLHEDVCKKLFSLDGFTAGIGMGGGYNLTRLFSVTGLVQMEYNFSNDVMLNFAPGFAFNLHEVWPWARRTLRSMWITFEIGGQRSFNRDVDEWSNVFLLGFQLGV